MLKAIKRLFSITFILAVFIYGASCTSKNNKPPQNNSIIQEAERKIHLSQYSEAETDLKNLLKEEPRNARAKVVLASLYVHRAGVRVEDHIHLEEVISFKPTGSKTYIQPGFIKTFTDSTDKDLKQFGENLVQLNTTMVQMQAWQEKLSQLPDINQQQASDLSLAISTLQSLAQVSIKSDGALPSSTPNEEVTEGMILYRSVIKIYLFKYLWNEDKFLPVADKNLCQSKLERLQQGLQKLENYVSDLLQDFAIGLPKEKENTLSQLTNFKKGTQQIQSWLASVSPEAETMADILAEQLQNEDIKCNF